ncbi:MAG: transcription elongation factor Elf1 [Halocynthiibacter sp.]|jgi:transcription elongation factor Elf1
MSKRPPIPAKMKHQIMYESAFSCAVCGEKGDQIHHIDKNNANNTTDNLILLCQSHHDEAHTTRELSLNLSPDRLKKFRASWIETVRDNRFVAASKSGQCATVGEFLSVGVAWGYINHSRLLQTAPKALLDEVDQSLFSRLKRGGIVDERGILIQPNGLTPSGTYLRNTVYDWYPHTESIALHILYSELVDRFVELGEPIHLDESTWNRTFIKEMIRPGRLIFLNRAQYFKKIHEDVENAEVAVQTFKRKIKVKYQINTRNMYGTTSITCSFSGHQTCASVLQVKSIEDQGADRILHCTPIALGVGFHSKTAKLLSDPANHRINYDDAPKTDQSIRPALDWHVLGRK